MLPAVLLLVAAAAVADDASQLAATDTRPGIAPDIRDDETSLKVQRGNFVVVPIPISNPTLDTGLVAGAAYFYPQSAEKEATQPASLTGAAGLYTSNDSKAFGIAQQNYWHDDKWRFTGMLGATDLRLGLLVPDASGNGASVDWRIKGSFLFAKLATRITGNWYGGIFTRMVDANQRIAVSVNEVSAEFDIGDVVSAGLGLVVEYDSRDMPLNSYTGRHVKIDALFNDEAFGSNQTYQSYRAAYRSYHRLTDSVVLAWEIQGCHRGDGTPLWDACTVKLRGFSATDYMGTSSASAQLEARWQLNRRWGLVGFAGRGYADNVFSRLNDKQAIPSYGAGVRFSVLPAKRVNLRVDFARSGDSDAVHISVGEAF
jgi:hypothetical protein